MPGLEQARVAGGDGEQAVMAVKVEANNRFGTHAFGLRAIENFGIGRIDRAEMFDVLAEDLSGEAFLGAEDGFRRFDRRMALNIDTANIDAERTGHAAGKFTIECVEIIGFQKRQHSHMDLALNGEIGAGGFDNSFIERIELTHFRAQLFSSGSPEIDNAVFGLAFGDKSKQFGVLTNEVRIGHQIGANALDIELRCGIVFECSGHQVLPPGESDVSVGPVSFRIANRTASLTEIDTKNCNRAAILFPMPLPEAFDYLVPEGMELHVGDHVKAPLGNRMAGGVVWALKDGPGDRKLKFVESASSGAPIPAGTRTFVDWVAKYLVLPPGVVLRAVLRSTDALKPSPVETLYRLSGEAPPRMTAAREKVLDTLAGLELAGATDIAREAGVSAGVVKGLAQAGALEAISRPVDPPFDVPDPEMDGLKLTILQVDAAGALRKQVKAGGFQAALLDGVTGSGKTEVYFEAIAEVLRQDPDAQILIMLPEIALTEAVIARFEQRFGAAPALWHSGAGSKARRRAWREVAEGRARIVVGARSALFLPFANLKLVIVDEEHDPTYKQDEGMPYQGRDLAVARCKLEKAMVILASATPSLESLSNARAGRYVHVRLPGRPGVAVLPEIAAIDLRETPAESGHWLSPPMVAAMVETLERGEQSLLYLNRRGYAPLVLCRACGHRMKSPDTASYLVEHRYTGRLVCHVTGFSMAKPKACPECGAEESLTSIGPGVERVAEEARRTFPEARVEVYSSDSSSGAELVAAMERGEIDIMVGTQIAAKGHNFPNLTLVGVVDADLGLAGGDPRAGERTFQNLVQAAGRAGRAERPGRALLQTHQPEHEAIQALIAGDRDSFIEMEMMAREMLGLPPFGRLAAISFMALNPDAVDKAAGNFAAAAPSTEGVEIWGPAEPPRAIVRGWHRRRILLRADREIDISAYLRAWKTRVKTPSSVRVSIDVEPYSFM